MPDMQQQIESLREAFSADTSKPFVLKTSFPYGSPVVQANPSPSRGGQYRQPPQLLRPSSMDQHHSQQQHVSYVAHPITPPISAGGVDTKGDSPAIQSLVMMATGQRVPQQKHQQQQQTMPSSIPMVDASSMNWNPSRIFE
jgi:hypothetical protein